MIFVGKPDAAHCRSACSTSGRASTPVIARYWTLFRLSRLMFTPFTPMRRSSGTTCAKSQPFVVTVTDSTPGKLRSSRIKPTAPLRTKGSPPVTLNFVMPTRRAARQISMISS